MDGKMSESKPSWITENVPPEVAEQLFKFKIKLPNGTMIEADMAISPNVDYDAIEDELIRTPHQYVWWASLYSEAKAYVAVVERTIKVRRGNVTQIAINTAANQNVRLSEKVLMNVVEKDDVLNKLEVELANAQKNAGKLYHMVQAVQMKSEHLRSLAGFKRQEREQQTRS
jgi:hypothetical protein